MAVSLTHTTQATGTDAGSGEIRKAQWNEAHTLTMAADFILGRATAGAGAVEEISCTAFGRSLIGDSSASEARTTMNVDVASTDNSTPVTLAGVGTYLSLTGQQITVDEIAYDDIAAADRTGVDTNLVTGTAGTSGDLSVWNSDGDLVDGPTPPSGAIVGTSDTQTLSNKTISNPTITTMNGNVGASDANL